MCICMCLEESDVQGDRTEPAFAIVGRCRTLDRIATVIGMCKMGISRLRGVLGDSPGVWSAGIGGDNHGMVDGRWSIVLSIIP